MFSRFINFVDWLNERVGTFAACFTTVLVLVICMDVVSRYLFQETAVWIVELEWHLFALIFLLSGGYALKHDKHVRVDLFYAKFSKRDKALLNLFGSVVFLIPWCLVLMYYAFQFAYLSFLDGEGSPNPGGLPARYFIKSMIALGLFLLLLQAMAIAARSIQTLQQTEEA